MTPCQEVAKQAALNELKAIVLKKKVELKELEDTMFDEEVVKAGEKAERAGATLVEIVNLIADCF